MCTRIERYASCQQLRIQQSPFPLFFRGDDVEQRVYGTILRTREPATASVIAERVDCDPKTARKYLRWFADLGIVTRHDGYPTTYERNDAYFEWRRINHLAAEHSVDELQECLRELTTRITSVLRPPPRRLATMPLGRATTVISFGLSSTRLKTVSLNCGTSRTAVHTWLSAPEPAVY